MVSKTLVKHNAKSEPVTYEIDDLWPNDHEEMASPPPAHAFVSTILSSGVIQPIITTRYRNKLHLIDGRRRIKGARLAREWAIEDPEVLAEHGVGDTSHLDIINAREYQGISPHNRRLWSIILNEQRSDNALTTYRYLKELKEGGKWEQYQAFWKGNPQTATKIMKLDNLAEPELIFKAYEEKNIAVSTMYALADLNEQRQLHLGDILKEKGRLTGGDIKEMKKTRTTEALSQLPYVADTPKIKLEVNYVAFNGTNVAGPFESFNDALTEAHLMKGNVYKKVK